MSSANRRAALTALDRGRSAVDRLSVPNRPPAEQQQNIRQAWSATEVALRALVGGSPAGGQSLVRELRTAGMLNLDDAHALVDFAAVRDRAESDSYVPSDDDLRICRDGFRRIDDALNSAAVAESQPVNLGAAPASTAEGLLGGPPRPAAVPLRTEGERTGSVQSRRSKSMVIMLVLALLLIVLPALGWWYWTQRADSPRRVNEAVALYSRGNLESARFAFEDLARARPGDPLPRVYLGRIAREQGDMATANRELRAAIELDPQSALAQREMGSFLLAAGDANLARRFYVRAIELAPADSTAMGYLGCALVRIGRMDQAQLWFQRAGPGDWQRCIPRGPAPMPPPGGYAPIR